MLKYSRASREKNDVDVFVVVVDNFDYDNE